MNSPLPILYFAAIYISVMGLAFLLSMILKDRDVDE